MIMDKKTHGNTGKRNAAKAVTKNSQLNVRIRSETKALCVAQAHHEGLNLSAWIQKTLDEMTISKK